MTGDQIGAILSRGMCPQDHVPCAAAWPPFSARRVKLTSAGNRRRRARLVPLGHVEYSKATLTNCCKGLVPAMSFDPSMSCHMALVSSCWARQLSSGDSKVTVGSASGIHLRKFAPCVLSSPLQTCRVSHGGHLCSRVSSAGVPSHCLGVPRKGMPDAPSLSERCQQGRNCR